MPACRYLYRPYGRVDRAKLKRRLLDRCNVNGEARAQPCTHQTQGLQLRC